MPSRRGRASAIGDLVNDRWQIAADYGADVVRVEPPEIDAVDAAGATPAYLLLQRGKRPESRERNGVHASNRSMRVTRMPSAPMALSALMVR